MEKENNNRIQESLLIDIAEVQRCYIPLSKRKIRNLVQTYIRTIKIGNKIMVDRKQLEQFLVDPDRDHII